MRIAVTGREGQVVSSLLARAAYAGADVIAIGRPELDLAAPETILPAFAGAMPDVIVSAAAYTAVDKAESELELARAVNATGAGAVAMAAAALGVPVVHLSTDYVFSGDKPEPYAETDPTSPLGVYGATKLEGEQAVAGATPDHVILRCAWVYSPFGANFVKTMLRVGETRDVVRVVHDQHGRPTSALDIADAIFAISRNLLADSDPGLRGVFHLAAGGEATWAEFAEAIFHEAALRGRKIPNVERITTADYPTPARRPANSRLDGSKLAKFHGINLPDWHDSLRAVMDELVGPPI